MCFLRGILFATAACYVTNRKRLPLPLAQQLADSLPFFFCFSSRENAIALGFVHVEERLRRAPPPRA